MRYVLIGLWLFLVTGQNLQAGGPADLTERGGDEETLWSLRPLAEPPVPAIENAAASSAIDRFLLARLQPLGLSFSPPADRRTLIRRLTFDLHGLPPTPEEIDAFEQDNRPDAYARLVDRLLASPRYGERWGRHWLDIVHFGETHGYDKDKPRPNAWPYRDYVISALNEDVPYSRFVQMQLAGDVLFPNDPQGVIATGFIAAGPWDFVGHVELREGTTDKLIARSNDRDDMVMTAMSTFQSLTVHCARCHDHKFDPITQEDYYRLQAVFSGIDRGDRPYEPDLEVTAERARLTAAHTTARDRHSKLQAVADQITSPEIRELDARRAELDQQWTALPAPLADEASPTLGWHSAIMPKTDVEKWVQVDLGESRRIDAIFLVPAHVKYGGHPGPGFGFPPRLRIEVSDDPEFRTSVTVADRTAADVSHPGDTPFGILVPEGKGRYVRVTATRLWKRTDDWIFALSEMLVFGEGKNLAAGAPVTSLDSIEAGTSWGRRHLVDGNSSEKRLTTTAAAWTERLTLLMKRSQVEEQRRALVLAALDPETRSGLATTEKELSEIETALAALPAPGTHRVYGIVPLTQPREIALLRRGDVKQPAELMSPGAVASVPGLDAEFAIEHPEREGDRRAALARWITDPRNGLMRRSIVNRVWQSHFGVGLVDTPNDFGLMGSSPSHPELLDWLAFQFQKDGESLKRLHRQIVLSTAYQQSSASHPQGEMQDASNRWLWRMNRTRLDAEAVRDAVLAVSGKLDLRMGGPSDQQFFFKDDHSPVYDYDRFDVDDPRGFRRSVYRFLVRSVPDPFMDRLDCADPSLLTPKRNVTLTSIQALALLNNKFMIRQAAHFAERITRDTAEPAEQIRMAYRLALSREPDAEEARLLLDYQQQHGLPAVCRLILNSNEFLFID